MEERLALKLGCSRIKDKVSPGTQCTVTAYGPFARQGTPQAIPSPGGLACTAAYYRDRRRVKRKCAILEQVTGCKNHYPAHWAWVAYGGKHALCLLIDVLRRAKEQQASRELRR